MCCSCDTGDEGEVTEDEDEKHHPKMLEIFGLGEIGNMSLAEILGEHACVHRMSLEHLKCRSYRTCKFKYDKYADAVIGDNGANISYIRLISGANIVIQETRGVPDEMTVKWLRLTSPGSTSVDMAQISIEPLLVDHRHEHKLEEVVLTETSPKPKFELA